jgi:hypothetical protein
MEDETQLMKDVRRTLNAMRNYEQVSSKRERLTNIQQTIRYLREQPPAQPFANALQFPNVDFTQPIPLAQETISPLVAAANVAKPPSPQPERKVESSERKVESIEIKKEIPIAAEVPNPFLEKPAEIAKSEEIKTEPKPNVDITVKTIVNTSKYLLTFQFTYVALVMHLRACLFQRSTDGKEIIIKVQTLLDDDKSDENLTLIREYLSLAWAKMLPFSAVWNYENTGFISNTLIHTSKAKEMEAIASIYTTLAGNGKASINEDDDSTLKLSDLFSERFVSLIGDRVIGVVSKPFAKTTHSGIFGMTTQYSYDNALVTEIWQKWLYDLGTLLKTDDSIEQLTQKIDADTKSWFNFKSAWAKPLETTKNIETTPLCKDFFAILNVLSQETIPKWKYTDKECKTETHFDLIMEIGNIVKIAAVDSNSPKDVQNKIRCGLQSAFADIFSAAMIEWSKHIFVNGKTGNFTIDDAADTGLTPGWASKLFSATSKFLSYFSTG